MKRASYRAAIRWMAENDDTEWLHEPPHHPSVTACIVADLFGVDVERVESDLRRCVAKVSSSIEEQARADFDNEMARGELLS